MASPTYTYNAPAVMARLPQKTQSMIEYLRKNHLKNWIHNGKAYVANNQVNPPEYWVSVPALSLTIYFYEEYAPPHEMIIFDIRL
jgi:hypothetical protein